MAGARGKPPDPFRRAFESVVAEHRRGNLTRAIAGYKRLLVQRPKNGELLANLATALKQAGRREEALECFRRAVGTVRAPPEVWFNFGNLLAELKQLAEAEAAYRKALELDPGLYRAATNLANLLSDLKRTDEAIELHRRAIAAAIGNLPSLRARRTTSTR